MFPLTSITVKVTELAPTFAQVNVVVDRESDAIPHASDEPLFTAAAVVVPFPEASKLTVTG